MKITIYGKDNCPFCEMAKRWFDKRNLEYDYILLNDSEERQKFYESYGKHGVNTVPQIIVDGVRLGGYTELMQSEFARNIDQNV